MSMEQRIALRRAGLSEEQADLVLNEAGQGNREAQGILDSIGEFAEGVALGTLLGCHLYGWGFDEAKEHFAACGTRFRPREIGCTWDEVREDAKGLFVKGRLLPDVARGREAAGVGVVVAAPRRTHRKLNLAVDAARADERWVERLDAVRRHQE